MTLPLLALLVSFYFALHGFRSVTEQKLLGEEIEQLEAELAIIHSEKKDLELHVGLLSKNHVDPDYLDELVRKDLGFTHPDEIVIPNRNSNRKR